MKSVIVVTFLTLNKQTQCFYNAKCRYSNQVKKKVSLSSNLKNEKVKVVYGKEGETVRCA